MSPDVDAAASLIAEALKGKTVRGKTLVVGLCGVQGSGKSTIAEALSAGLSRDGLVAPVISLDDLYRPRLERQALAQAVHPLLATRGPPGTHNVEFGLSVLEALEDAGSVRLPRFDKAADEPLPLIDWPVVQGPADVIILEGWCVGARPESIQALAAPINALERRDDPHAIWRNWVNGRLAADYQALFARLDMLVLLAAPDVATVVEWRGQQEAKLRGQLLAEGHALGATMDQDQIERFVEHYERITRHILREMPERADLVLYLDRTRSVVRVQAGPAKTPVSTSTAGGDKEPPAPRSDRAGQAHPLSPTPDAGLLKDLRVLELGHFVAAPFASRLLADLGADVIKVEPPGGDPVRGWGEQIGGRSLWWSVHGRNKRCITADLKRSEARALILGLVAHCDVVIENFRPGQLEKLGLGEADLRAVRPDLIIAHISGYGQTGPYRDRAAFGVIGEAIGGLRHLSNHPPGTADLPPVRVGVSVGDSLAGLYAAFGVMAALWRRDAAGRSDGVGRTLDVALTESVLSLMEGMLPEYGVLGKIKQPLGGGIATAAPTNAYPTADGAWILIAANSEPLFARLMALMGRPDLARTPRFASNQARVANTVELDGLIGAWTQTAPASDLLAWLERADIPATKVFTAADCADDPQYRARGMVREVEDPAFGRGVLHPGIAPHVVETPGVIRWPGPDVGAHNGEVFRELLGISEDKLAQLSREGVI